MAGERTLPNLGLTAFWTAGDSTWKPGMDLNLLTLSAVVQLNVLSATTPFPFDDSNSTAFADGDIYIVPASDSNSLQDSNSATMNHGDIAIHDDGLWIYVTPREGWIAYVADESAHKKFDGTTWVALTSGSFAAGDVAYNPEQDSNSGQGVTTVQEALDDIYNRVLDIPVRTTFVSRTASFVLTAADENTFNSIDEDSNSGASITCGVPSDSLEALEIGFTASFVQNGSTAVTFESHEDSNSGATVTLLYPADMTPFSRVQNSVVSVTKKAANVWLLYGDLLPA